MKDRMIPLRYQALIGVGGVGTGQFFLLNGNHTLGREESRSGRFLDRRDYCKLHIIAHYAQALLGPDFTTIPVSKVGADEAGRRLRSEMQAAGLDVRYLLEDPVLPTLFALCFQYPDGSGGNLTTDVSAANTVQEQDVAASEAEFARFAGRGIALAAPESPPEARAAIFRMGDRHRFFRAMALTTAETGCTWALELLRQADLTALNMEEAASFAQIEADALDPEIVVRAAVTALGKINPKMMISITAGARGSWSWDGVNLNYLPALVVPVVNTAGAGDAHLAGILAGLTWGLELRHAQEIGNLAAAESVTSPHTIHPGICRSGLLPFARQNNAPLSEPVNRLLESIINSEV
jgi:ribokinase